MKLLNIAIFVFYITAIKTHMYEDIKKNVLALLKRRNDNIQNNDSGIRLIKTQPQELSSINSKRMQNEVGLMQKAEPQEFIDKQEVFSNLFTVNPNVVQKTDNKLRKLFRRKYSEETYRESSTSAELQEWKDDYDQEMVEKKIEAIQAYVNTSSCEAEVVNMAAARPWSISCGDPNQHDVAWGTCLMPQECDSEFRIYRGDIFCGKSEFVCCSLLLSHHDLYQAMDQSFIDSSGSTSSEEQRKQDRGQREVERRKRIRAKHRLIRARRIRKERIKKLIRMVVRQIRRTLDRGFRNATVQRRKKLLELKDYIQHMKTQLYKERKEALDVLELDLEHIDENFMGNLEKIKQMNRNFMMLSLRLFNRTGMPRHKLNRLRMIFPQLLRYDTNPSNLNISIPGILPQILPRGPGIPKHSPKVLPKAKVLPKQIPKKLLKKTRRLGGGFVRKKKRSKRKKPKDYLEYDIEYGALFY